MKKIISLILALLTIFLSSLLITGCNNISTEEQAMKYLEELKGYTYTYGQTQTNGWEYKTSYAEGYGLCHVKEGEEYLNTLYIPREGIWTVTYKVGYMSLTEDTLTLGRFIKATEYDGGITYKFKCEVNWPGYTELYLDIYDDGRKRITLSGCKHYLEGTYQEAMIFIEELKGYTYTYGQTQTNGWKYEPIHEEDYESFYPKEGEEYLNTLYIPREGIWTVTYKVGDMSSVNDDTLTLGSFVMGNGYAGVSKYTFRCTQGRNNWMPYDSIYLYVYDDGRKTITWKNTNVC